jgi:hypothetical protein
MHTHAHASHSGKRPKNGPKMQRIWVSGGISGFLEAFLEARPPISGGTFLDSGGTNFWRHTFSAPHLTPLQHAVQPSSSALALPRSPLHGQHPRPFYRGRCRPRAWEAGWPIHTPQSHPRQPTRGFRKNLYCKNLYRKNLYSHVPASEHALATSPSSLYHACVISGAPPRAYHTLCIHTYYKGAGWRPCIE